MKTILIVFIMTSSLLSSCNNKQIKNHFVKYISIKKQDSLIKQKLEEVQSIKYSNDMNEIYSEYNIKDTTCWIEGAEDSKLNRKIIFFTKSYIDNDDNRNDIRYKILTDKNNNINFVTFKSDKEEKIKLKDTFFFKNNKIYFWKNKQATKEELLKKEKEILAIKKEIDSIMEW